MHGEVDDRKTSAPNIGQGNGIETFVFHICDLAARQTHEMMMLVRIRFEPGGRPGVTDSGDYAHAHERLQHAIDRGSGDLRNPLSHSVKHLVGGGVVIAAQHGLEDHPPLDGHRETRPTAPRFELLESLIPFPRLHVAFFW
jgi:hypothetical protein